VALVSVVMTWAAGCSLRGEPAPSAYDQVMLAAPVDDLDRQSLLQAAQRSREYFRRRKDADIHYRIGRRDVGIAELAATNEHLIRLLETVDYAELPRRIARDCRAYASRERARFTAYYEPELVAAAVPDERFRYPVYAPPDPVTLAMIAGSSDADGNVAWPTRADIDGRGVLSGKGLEIAWLEDPVALYFLHVQGSGRLRMRDGSVLRLGFAASNNHPYTSIGRSMLNAGLLGPNQGSSEAIRKWLREHPERRDEILFENPRYIFFRALDVAADEGPLGSLGVSLVAGRSMATDRDHVPPGALTYIETNRPVADGAGRLRDWAPVRRFAFSHDEGAAIQGVARADIYWGTGEALGAEAGFMNLPGNLYVILCDPS
jgi:membrane-bound lytic murein transglycosylase A